MRRVDSDDFASMKHLCSRRRDRRHKRAKSQSTDTSFVTAPSRLEHSFSPPEEPRAHREERRYLERHATEAQDYWSAYFTRSCPASASSPPDPSNGSVSRRDSVTDTVDQSRLHEAADRAYKTDIVLRKLRAGLAQLQDQASHVATFYRRLGLLFHSFPFPVFWHKAIDPEIRSFARSNFLHGGGEHPKPDIIHVIGTLEHTLCSAEAALRQPWLVGSEVVKVEAALELAGRLMKEAVEKLELLRQAVHIFCRMRTILWLEGKGWEGAESRRRRTRLYQSWAHALPLLCWEGAERLEDVGESDIPTMAWKVSRD